jgi:FAD/FMN-containing dehydrogenase
MEEPTMADVRIATTTGSDTVLDEATVQGFKTSLRGQLLTPGDAGYDEARTVWNGMFDRRPALIARCAGVGDVINCVNFARANTLLISVRGGDHSLAGHSVCVDGLMIDLSSMRSIRVDPATQTARAEGGARWRDFDHETQAFGLATTGGTNSDTGIGGLTLGGGLGWLAGKYGLACDNLLSADVVTADGRVLTASPTQNADLFWGLRGGSGNFGIVTSFEYQLHPVGPVLGGLVIHPFDKAKDVLRFYRDFSTTIPDEVNTLGALLTTPEGLQVAAIAVCYNGALEQGDKVLRPLREFGPPVVDQIGPMSYTVLQTMTDGMFPRGRQYYWKASLMNRLSDDAIQTIIDYFAAVPSPHTVIGFQQLGNAANRVGQDETAFSHRDALYDFLMLSGWEDPAEAERSIRWTRELANAIQPFLHGGIYVNAFTDDSKQAIRDAYRPGTYERLVALKNKYDPENLFRLNPNIKPTVSRDPGHEGGG